MANKDTLFELEIIRPEKTRLLSVAWLEIESSRGSMTIGPGHAPLVAILRQDGTVTYADQSGRLAKLEISSGVFSISDGRAVIIVN